MTRLRIAAMVGLAFGAGVAVVLLANWLLDRGEAVAPVSDTSGKVLYWFDPMYPDRHFEQPGKSPFMDMMLVPKYASSGNADAGSVRIDSRMAQNLGVRLGKATHGSLESGVRATATVGFDERSASAVQARVNGIVERLLVRSPLAMVDRGQSLMVLIAPEWTAAQEEYLALRRTTAPTLEAVRSAARRRLILLGMTESQIRAIERSDTAQARITLSAPRSGVITELAVREGETVMAGATLARINGLDTVWVLAAIAEAQIERVASGAAVEVSLSAFPGQKFDGVVETLLPTLNEMSRTQTARIVLANPGYRLTPGMIGEVRVTSELADHLTLVPSEAVISTGQRNVVVVVAGDGAYRAQEVRVGVEAGGQSAILAGIEPGDTVVLSGQFLIDSEASLTGALSRLDEVPSRSASEEKGPVERHQASGQLLRIDGDEWLVDTGPIASLDMGAMRMRFAAPTTAQTAQVGAHLEFEFFRNQAGDFEIDGRSIRILEHASGRAP